jgi:predicted PurR-regulated permease PerM
VTDTQIEYTDTPADPDDTQSGDSDSLFDSATALPIAALIVVFGLPVFIVFITLYFKYKNRKAKYRLVEQALAAGQPLPESVFNEKAGNGILQKGITNVFTGIGLFIFLWAVSEEFSMGCVGLLIMFMGFGQIVIHYTNNKKEEAKQPDSKE